MLNIGSIVVNVFQIVGENTLITIFSKYGLTKDLDLVRKNLHTKYSQLTAVLNQMLIVRQINEIAAFSKVFREGVVVLKELIFNCFYFGRVWWS